MSVNVNVGVASCSLAYACALGEAQDNQDAQFILGWKDGADPQADGAD